MFTRFIVKLIIVFMCIYLLIDIFIVYIYLENIRNSNNNSNSKGNLSAITNICPLIVQNVILRSVVNFLKQTMDIFFILIATSFPIPGIFGNLLSLILLNIKKMMTSMMELFIIIELFV